MAVKKRTIDAQMLDKCRALNALNRIVRDMQKAEAARVEGQVQAVRVRLEEAPRPWWLPVKIHKRLIKRLITIVIETPAGPGQGVMK